jgi:hypothetical protein
MPSDADLEPNEEQMKVAGKLAVFLCSQSGIKVTRKSPVDSSLSTVLTNECDFPIPYGPLITIPLGTGISRKVAT